VEIYLVGGALRDKLLNIPVTDKDWVVVGATPEQMLAQNYRPVGADFPVFLHPKTHEEYALARTERKTGKGYTGFKFHASPDVTLKQDLMRRDLTINAMAEDQNGKIIDPYNGQQDLKQKILRHVSPSFVEDPVRILRTARFAANFKHLDFTIAEETYELMQTMVRNGEVDALVPERVWQEFATALKSQNPEIFIAVLRQVGALNVLFPELDKLFGVPSPPEFHPEIDSGIHSLNALKQACKLTSDPIIRFAALVHDLGKALTPIDQWPKHLEHEANSVQQIKSLCNKLRPPKAYQELAELVAKFHLKAHHALEMTPGKIVKLLEQLDAFRRPERFSNFLSACQADMLACTATDYPQADFLKQAYKIANQVDPKEIIKQGFTGPDISNKLHEQRVNEITKLLHRHPAA